MKKILFIISVVILSVISIMSTLSGIVGKSKENISQGVKDIFENSGKLSYYDNTSKSFKLPEENSAINSENYYYKSINAIDGVYFKSPEPDPIKIENNGTKYDISIKKGEYLFVLNDDFNDYEIISDNIKIKQVSKGIFFLIVNQENSYLYSFNSTLSTELLSDGAVKSKALIMPSLLFFYKYELNKNLHIDSDILRVGTVNTIVYKDSQQDIEKLFFKNDTNNILNISFADINKRIEILSNYFTYILDHSYSHVDANLELAKEYEELFFNEKKKDILRKNELSKNLIDLFKLLKSNKNNTEELELNISNILSDVSISQEDKKEYEEIFKKHYYVVYYPSYSFIGGDLRNTTRSTMYKSIKKKNLDDNLYNSLTNIFFSYKFSKNGTDKLDYLLNNLLNRLLKNSMLVEEDFSNLSYFLTKYTSSNYRVNTSSINIIIHLINIFERHYSNLGTEISQDDEKSSYLTQFYLYLNDIVGGLEKNIKTKYFTLLEGKSILKEEYVTKIGEKQYKANIDENFKKTLMLLVSDGYKKAISRSQEYSAFLEKDINVTQKKTNNFVALNENFKKLIKTANDIDNYTAYYSKLEIKQETLDAQALEYSDEHKFSKEYIIKYFKDFNGFDMDKFKLMNEFTMSKDKYYKIEATIVNKVFEFNYYPRSTYIDSVKKKNPDTGVSEDTGVTMNLVNLSEGYEKKNESLASDMSRFEFRDVFIDLLIKDYIKFDNGTIIEDPVEVNPNDDDFIKNETKQISDFKQKSLINGDFAYVKDIIRIPYKNIRVEIIDGDYDIEISKIEIMLNINSKRSKVIFFSKYNFVGHYFYDTYVQVFEERGEYHLLNNSNVYILPSRIRAQDFDGLFKELELGLNTLTKNFDNGTNLKINLKSRQVFIDSKSFNFLETD